MTFVFGSARDTEAKYEIKNVRFVKMKVPVLCLDLYLLAV